MLFQKLKKERKEDCQEEGNIIIFLEVNLQITLNVLKTI